jgi:hypothetical protein
MKCTKEIFPEKCQVCYHEPATKFFKTETRGHAWCEKCLNSSGFKTPSHHYMMSFITYEEYLVNEIMQS